MDIVIITQYAGDIDHPEKYNSRFTYLAKMLSKGKCEEIELITTTFMHNKKKQADCIVKSYEGCRITALYEPGYPKNVCLRRFYSHRVLAKNVKQYLASRKKPDVVYAAVPSLDVAGEAAEYCKKNHVRFLLDIQDLWPEAFQMVFHVPVISNLVFAPMQRKADKIYVAADEIFAVSQTYADRALQVNSKASANVVYLGTDRKEFDRYASSDRNHSFEELGLSNDSVIRLVYAGTLGSSYDLGVIFKALRMLDNVLLEKIQFLVMGDGPKRRKFEEQAAGLPVLFAGRLPYQDMVWIMTRCDIAINAIVRGAAQSIINKHADYAMAGLPVVSTQETGEYSRLIEEYNCGINCRPEEPATVRNAIEELVKDEQKRVLYGKNSRKLGEEKFDREKTYTAIYQQIVKQ